MASSPMTSWPMHQTCGGAKGRPRPSRPDDRRRRAPLRPQFRSALRRAGLIDSPCPDVDHHSIVIARGAETHQLVADIAQHPRGIALHRVAPPAQPRLLVTEDVAPL